MGFPAYAFARTWTSLPTDHFGPLAPSSAPMRTHFGQVAPVEEARLGRLLDEAFASAADAATRREIALNEMMTPWPDAQRTAFQKLREAQATYATGDEARSARFVTLLARVDGGTGRSVATDDAAAGPGLDTAYAATLSREGDEDRARTEAAQKSFVAYRDAFAAFAEARSAGAGAGVAAELDRQRAADLAAEGR